MAVGQVGDRTVAVTSGNDGTVALWRVGEDGLALAGDPQPGHGGTLSVRAVAVGQVGDRTVAVTSGNDGTVALWRVGEDGLALAGDPQPSTCASVVAAAGSPSVEISQTAQNMPLTVVRVTGR